MTRVGNAMAKRRLVQMVLPSDEIMVVEGVEIIFP
jgi:hypothetical protein